MTRVDYITGACFPVSIFGVCVFVKNGSGVFSWKQFHLSARCFGRLVSPRDPMHDYSALFDLYSLLSATHILRALCHFRWHIYKDIGLSVKSLIVEQIDGVWSRTLCLCLRTAALLLFTNQGVHVQHLWFSSIPYWTSLCLVSAEAACLTSSFLCQLDNTSFSFGCSHRRPSQ
jgi:hypothetical protein